MFNTGLVVRMKHLIDALRYKEIAYVPKKFEKPPRLIHSESQAWVGLEQVLADIIDFSGINRNRALEFGVEFGYSTAALANYFGHVTGVDTFQGDEHAGYHGNLLEKTKANLAGFPNISLVCADYRDFIRTHDERFDLIHVDIVHTYEDTYACGLWSAQHSDCTIFHDTQSFPDVKKAVAKIAVDTRKKFYNYPKYNGLGIVI